MTRNDLCPQCQSRINDVAGGITPCKASIGEKCYLLYNKLPDLINHPPHYRAANGLESIDVIEAFALNFHLGNTIKYILRGGRKTEWPLEDLKKARWYLDREIATLEKELHK